jgi:hypothetical protein
MRAGLAAEMPNLLPSDHGWAVARIRQRPGAGTRSDLMSRPRAELAGGA